MSSRRQANVDKAVSLLRSKNLKVIGTTCNVGKAEDRDKLVNMVRSFFIALFSKYLVNILVIVLRSVCKCYAEPKSLWKLAKTFCKQLQTIEQCGGVDILVSNAAVNPFFGNILDSTEEVWDKV